MFGYLSINGTISARSASFMCTFRDILIGAITNASQLNSNFRVGSSLIEAGSQGFPSWTQVYPATVGSADTHVILRSQSYDPTRYNYLHLDTRTLSGQFTISTGTGYSGDTMLNEVNLPNRNDFTLQHTLCPYVSDSVKIYMSADNHSLVLTTVAAPRSASPTVVGEGILVAADLIGDLAAYGKEGSIKLGYLHDANGYFNIANMYSPKTMTYKAASPIALSVYNVPNLFTTASASRDKNLAVENPIYPFIINNMSEGRMGLNLSSICGLYLTKFNAYAHGTRITIDSQNYRVLNPVFNYSSANTSRFLLRE